MAALYDDSKTFVDMKLKNSANETFADFEELMTKTKNSPSRDELSNFVSVSFFSYT